MKEIALANGRGVALIDDGDYDRVRQYHWSNNGVGYPRAWIDGSKVRLSRFIMGCRKGDGVYVDHWDRNPLNNQRHNLRPCTQSQNMANATKPRHGVTSKYKGVRWHTQRHKYTAQISINDRSVYVGIFESEDDAARAYNAAALRQYGEFARLNEVPS